jgi:hypothetical protein
MNSSAITPKLIAPCGMNCGICMAHLRKNNPCPGCNIAAENKPKTRAQCPLRLCHKRKGTFCWNCKEFPCERLQKLDHRYRMRYGMSEIENLKYIKEHGIKKFIEREQKKWISDKGVLCVHDKKYYKGARDSFLKKVRSHPIRTRPQRDLEND